MSTLSVDSSTVVWTTINFIVLLGVLHRFALPSLYRMIEDNEQKRDQLLSELEFKTAEANRLRDEYTKKMAVANEEAKRIVDQATKEAEELSRSEAKRIAEQKQSALTGLTVELAQERQQLIQTIKGEAADLIVTAAQKVIQVELTPDTHRELINQSIARFETVVTHGSR